MKAITKGKLVVAHPDRVAQADQIAASEDIKNVKLSKFVDPKFAYVIDVDKLMELPERSWLF